ncbi:MAG: prephenate dehydratase [Acidobacteria bacterium]|nr:MAG: prephenate dehydratase [Acidobacteriota bacterium]
MRLDPVAFLGPAGTFTEEALMSQPDLADATHVPMTGVFEIVKAIESGDVACGVVPIENSIEGSVNATLDALAFDTSDVYIEREVVLGVDLNLVGISGTEIDSVSAVLSHPHAIAQCRRYLSEKTPGADQIATISTADAVRQVAEAGDRHQVAIGTRLAASLYGLEVLEEQPNDYPGNATRFVLLGKEIPAASGHDKTSIVCFQAVDRPGSLLGILHEFAARAINLTKIESRPTKTALGDYCFVIDFEGHVADEVVADALVNLRAKLANLRFLGSYPSATGEAAEIRAERGAAYEAAVEFVRDLRERVTPP